MAPDDGDTRSPLKKVTSLLFMNCVVHQPTLMDTFESDPYLRKLLLSLDQKKWCLVPDQNVAVTNRILESIGVNDCFEGVLPFENIKDITEIEPERAKILMLDFNSKRLKKASDMGLLTAFVGSATDELSKNANYHIDTIYNMQEDVPELWSKFFSHSLLTISAYKNPKKQNPNSFLKKTPIFNVPKANNLDNISMLTSSHIISDGQMKSSQLAPLQKAEHMTEVHENEEEMGGTSSEKNFSWNKQPVSKSTIKLDTLNYNNQLASPRDFGRMTDDDFINQENLKTMQDLQLSSKKNLLEPMDVKPKKKHKKDHKKGGKADGKSLLPPLQDSLSATPPLAGKRMSASMDIHELSSFLQESKNVPSVPSDRQLKSMDHLHLNPLPMKGPLKSTALLSGGHTSSFFNETQFLPRTFQVA
jgi:hypothetical protein